MLFRSLLNKIPHVLFPCTFNNPNNPTNSTHYYYFNLFYYHPLLLIVTYVYIFFVTPTQCLKSKIQKHVILLLIIFQSLTLHIFIYLFTHLIFKISLFRYIHLKIISNFPIFINEITYIQNFKFFILK